MAHFAAQAVAVSLLAFSGQADPPPQGGLFEEFELPPVTREQLESAFKDRFPKPAVPPWARWLGGAGGTPGAGGLSPAALAAMLKMFGSFQGSGGGFDAEALAKLFSGLGAGAGNFDPSTLKDLLSLANRLGSQKDALKATYPQFDWDRFAELAKKIGSQPSNLADLRELMSLLERLKSEPGPLGSQDLESIKALLGRFQAFDLPRPGGSSSNPITDQGSLPGKAGALSAEALGKLGELLGKLGLNKEQIGQVAEWLKAIPAPGLKGNLAEWASNVDWARFSPGKWREWSPRWAVSGFDWLKPRLGFLNNLPSLRIPRIPTASLPGLPSVSLGAPRVTWREAALWSLAAILPILAILAYLWRDQLAGWLGGQAPRDRPSFDHISDLASLVQLYEREALRILGPGARFHHMRRIESELMDLLPAPDQRHALRVLTSLYERWRYLPAAWHPGLGEIREGTEALGIIAAGPVT